MSDNVPANWQVHLRCQCPNCLEDIDLIDDPDFWANNTLEICEHNTPESNDFDAVCPECGEEFIAELEY